VPQPSALVVEMAIEKPKRHRSPGIDQIPSEMTKARGITIRFQIHKLINSIWNKEELPAEWKVSIIVPIHKKADIIDCSNYRGISSLSTTYKILSNILLSSLTPYAPEINGDHQCKFGGGMSTTDHIFCIRHIEKFGIQ
jgi:sorting nexin-29